MMEPQPVAQTHYGNVVVSPVRPQDRRAHSPVEYHLSYINNLPVPLTVEWRSGLKFTLPSVPSFESNRLTIRVEITIQHSVKLDIQRVLSAVAEDASNELKAMKQSFSLSAQTSRYGSATFILDYTLSLEQLRAYGGSVYYHELDCVFSLSDFDNCPPHPYGEAGRNLCLIDAAEAAGTKLGFIYAIEIVDNAGTYGERYLNIGSKVYRVLPIKDNTRRNGVHVITNQPVEGSSDMSEREVLFYAFDVAEEELGLYRSTDEARNYGDTQQAKKEEMLNLEHQIQVEKAELVREKQQHDKEMIEKERALKAAEQERDRNARLIEEMRTEQEHRMKLERERVKDYYEDRSYERKDNNEMIKFLPAVIVGIGVVYAAAKKWFGFS